MADGKLRPHIRDLLRPVETDRPLLMGGTDFADRAACHVGARSDSRGIEFFAVVGVDPIVGIDIKDEFARCGIETPVAGAAQAAILL